ncbi:MAG: DUF4245 domain-containing protein, partial [Pseudolysinimonas sp.]
GRPIVAELGRAETPDEISQRKADASVKRRSNQTTLNLVIALIASLLVGIVVVFSWVSRPVVSQLEPVDFEQIAAEAQPSVDVPLAVPKLPDGWSANRAELVPAGADGLASWQIGLLTPSGQYIGLVQGIDANATWVSQQTAQAQATDKVPIGGTDWSAYDRRNVNDPGNLAYALVADFDRSTVVLGGTATDDEFATLAASVAAELGS